MTIIDRTERIREAAKVELDRSRGVLASACLTWSEPELVVWAHSTHEYTAELKVEFYEGENLVDIFEFFVCRDGVLTTSEDEVRQWIRDTVPDVVRRRKHP